MFMPLALLALWVLGLLSLGALGAGTYLVYAWYVGWVVGTAYLVGGVALLVFAVLGRPLVLLLCGRAGSDGPSPWRHGEVHRLARPDGTVVHVEVNGAPDAPALILTHGWGTDSTVWYYAKHALARQFRVIVWDLRGVGRSTLPPRRDFALETMARDLEAVLDLAGTQPVMLVGHSIGGMVTLTLSRLLGSRLRQRVAGLVLVHTTYTNPVQTTTFARVLRVVQTPLLTPLLYLMIALWPVVWLMNWLSFLNGTAHLNSAFTGFAGHQTRAQLDYVTLLQQWYSPAVLARGLLAMFQFDERATLAAIDVPVLVVPADRDPVLLPAASEVIHAAIASSQMQPLTAARHMGFVEHHAAFHTLVETFGATCSRMDQGRIPVSADAAPDTHGVR